MSDPIRVTVPAARRRPPYRRRAALAVLGLCGVLSACGEAREEYFVGRAGLFPPPFCDFTVSFPGRPEFALVRSGDTAHPQATVRTSVFMTRAECAPREPADLTAAMLAPGYAEQYDDAVITPVDDAPGPAVRVSGSLLTSFGRVRDEYLIVEGPQSILVLQTAGTEPRYPTREVRNFLASLRPVGAPPPERLYEFPVADRADPARDAAALPPAPPPPSEEPEAEGPEAAAPDVPDAISGEPPPADEAAGDEAAAPIETTDTPQPAPADGAAAPTQAATVPPAMTWRAVPGAEPADCRVAARVVGAAFDSLRLDADGLTLIGDGSRPRGGLAGAAAVVVTTGSGLARLDLTPSGWAVGDAETAFLARQALTAGRPLTVRIVRTTGPQGLIIDPAGFTEALDAAGCPPLG